MKKYLPHAVTAIIAVLASSAIAYGLVKHYTPRLVKVDLVGLFDEQKAQLEKQIKPGMSQDEQNKLFQRAASEVGRVDAAISQLVSECNCAVMNAAAIARLPEGSDAGIPDRTARVRAILATPVSQ